MVSHNIYAEVLNERSVTEIEVEAKRLGKIWNGEEIRRSISLFDKASDGWKTLNNLERTAFCLRESASLSIMISEYDDAFINLQKALKIDKRIKNIEGQVILYSLLSKVFERTGKIEKSLVHYKKALALSESTSDSTIAFANLIAGEYAYDYVDFDVALKYFETALIHANKTDDLNLKAEILLNIGSTNATKGNKDEGVEQIKQSQKLWHSTNNKRGIVLAFSRLGFIYLLTDEKQKAIDNYFQAKSMFPDDVDYREHAIMFSGIGTFNSQYGQLDLAENYFRLAVETHKKAKYENGQTAALHNLAQTLYLKGEITESKNLFQKALELSKKIDNKLFVAMITEDFGVIDFHEGKYDEAIKKLTYADKVIKQQSLELSRIENSIGKVYEKKEDYETARKFYTSALEVSRRTFDAVETSENLYDLAQLSKRDGKIEQALDESAESLQITESLYKDVGNQNLRKSYLANSYDRYELHIDLLLKLHQQFPEKGFEKKALQTSEKARSRLMLENLLFADRDLTLDADPQTVAEENELANLISKTKEKLTELLSDPNQSGELLEIKQLEDELGIQENQLEIVRADLRRNSPMYSSIKNYSEFDIGEFQDEVLDENTILLEFFFGKEQSYLWLISNKDIEVFLLPNAETLNEKIDNLLKLLALDQNKTDDNIEEYQKNRRQTEAKYWRESKEFSTTIFEQIIDKMEGKRLLIVPDGKLRYFPVSALPHPYRSGNTPLLITNEITYQPSGSLLSLIKKRKSNDDLHKRSFFVVSDPVYSLNDVRLPSKKNYYSTSDSTENSNLKSDLVQNESLNVLERLDASDEESATIFGLFNRDNSEVLSGFSANRQNFLNRQLSEFKVLHFATHGVFNEKFPDLSGIVLSQYDERSEKQNGLVWLQDIYRLKLTADLVVLSACDTAIGEDIKGEGLQSLTNGFLQIGAKSVISSHWKVEDNATLELMKSFYEILASENVPTSEALRQAKIKMFKNPNYQFPYYWSSFTLRGDFQNKPKLATNFKYKNYLILLLFAGIIFGIHKMKKKLFR